MVLGRLRSDIVLVSCQDLEGKGGLKGGPSARALLQIRVVNHLVVQLQFCRLTCRLLTTS